MYKWLCKEVEVEPEEAHKITMVFGDPAKVLVKQVVRDLGLTSNDDATQVIEALKAVFLEQTQYDVKMQTAKPFVVPMLYTIRRMARSLREILSFSTDLTPPSQGSGAPNNAVRVCFL